jgi:hypothetical protein
MTIADYSQLPCVPPQESAWCVLRCGTLTSTIEQCNLLFYDTEIPTRPSGFWSASGAYFRYESHWGNLKINAVAHKDFDVIGVISGDDMRVFLESKIKEALK